jgi:hypothetical protein
MGDSCTIHGRAKLELGVPRRGGGLQVRDAGRNLIHLNPVLNATRFVANAEFPIVALAHLAKWAGLVRRNIGFDFIDPQHGWFRPRLGPWSIPVIATMFPAHEPTRSQTFRLLRRH